MKIGWVEDAEAKGREKEREGNEQLNRANAKEGKRKPHIEFRAGVAV